MKSSIKEKLILQQNVSLLINIKMNLLTRENVTILMSRFTSYKCVIKETGWFLLQSRNNHETMSAHAYAGMYITIQNRSVNSCLMRVKTIKIHTHDSELQGQKEAGHTR